MIRRILVCEKQRLRNIIWNVDNFIFVRQTISNGLQKELSAVEITLLNIKIKSTLKIQSLITDNIEKCPRMENILDTYASSWLEY